MLAVVNLLFNQLSEVIKINDKKQGIAVEMIDRMKPLYMLEARSQWLFLK